MWRRAIWAAVLCVALYAIVSHLHLLLKVLLVGTWSDIAEPLEAFRLSLVTARVLFQEGVTTYGLPDAELLRYARQFGVPLVVAFPHAYPPSTLMMYLPLAGFPYGLAAAAWLLLGTVGLVAAMGIPRWLSTTRHPSWWHAFTPFLVLQFFPSQAALFSGQPLALMLGLYVAGIAALQRNRQVIGGCLLALGHVFKPQFHVVWVYLLFRRQWGACAAGLGLSVLLGGLARWQAGSGAYTAWLSEARGQTFGDSDLFNFSLQPLLARIVSVPESHPILLGVVGGLALLAGWWGWRRLRASRLTVRDELPYGVSLTILGVLLFSTTASDHHAVLALVPLLLLWADLPTIASIPSAVLWGISFLLLGVRHSMQQFPLFASGPLAVLTGTKTLALILLIFLVADRLSAVRLRLPALPSPTPPLRRWRSPPKA